MNTVDISSRRESNMGTKSESEEEIAARILFENITFIKLMSNENGEPGQVDYISEDIQYSCVLEVTTHTNEIRRALRKGDKDYTGIICRPELLSDWVIQTRDWPRRKLIEKEVIPQLQTLNVHGISEYYKSSHEWWMRKVPTLENAINVFNSASVEYVKKQTLVNRDETGFSNVVLLPMVNWTYGGPDSALEIIETSTLLDSGNRKKLSGVDARTRHLFIWVNDDTDGNVLEAFNSINLELPSRHPNLPAEITHLWIVHRKTEIGWYFDPAIGWRTVGAS